MADSDNALLLIGNYLRQGGGSVSDTSSASGYYAADAVDGDPGTLWRGTSKVGSDSLYFDCGATLGTAATRLFLHSNMSDIAIQSRATTAASWTSRHTASGLTDYAWITLSSSSTDRYWRLAFTGSQATSDEPDVYRVGLYSQYAQISDGENPKISVTLKEAGAARMATDGLKFRPKVREIADLQMLFGLIRSDTYSDLRGWWRDNRNFCAVYPEPTTWPGEIYDLCGQGGFGLAYKTLNKGTGYTGSLSFGSA